MLNLTATDSKIFTASGSVYFVTIKADGTGFATVSGGDSIDGFRFARLTLDFIGGELRASFHGECAMDRNPSDFDRIGGRVRMTSQVTDIVPMG